MLSPMFPVILPRCQPLTGSTCSPPTINQAERTTLGQRWQYRHYAQALIDLALVKINGKGSDPQEIETV
ncbi:hypothetical protein PoMZ_08278 [Pyricularia oryzae]|uniref:Uncharacterized protein n=1 Tax=Pyricularia oryzae TaxID=318829 RepID=A0A4P7NH74_PYROR|nr:hypothetical protein PoMZ_08278 [Pyricularia oryzae]